MTLRSMLLLILGLAIMAPEGLFAQPGYMRRGGSYDDSSRSKKRSKKRRRKNDDKVARPRTAGRDKESIENYLQARLKAIKKVYRAQGNFGRRMKSSWDNFWNKVYEDRKLFEVRLARQRLNLFESLASLDRSSHPAALTDFDKLQNTQTKAFENDLRKKMAQYFSQLNTDLRDYSAKQEKDRQEFVTQANQAWKAQKAAH